MATFAHLCKSEHTHAVDAVASAPRVTVRCTHSGGQQVKSCETSALTLGASHGTRTAAIFVLTPQLQDSAVVSDQKLWP